MLSALDEQKQLVTVVDAIPKRQAFTCPACGAAVRLKNGTVMRAHFAHVSLRDCQFYSENESAEHLQLKAELYQILSKTEQVEIEKILPDLGQIADLMVNSKLALEVQCSRLSETRLRERTRAYQEHGFQVLWLLGHKLWLSNRLDNLHKQFLYFSQNMGFHLWELDVARRQLRLKYLIYEDLFGKVYYQTKTCSFDGDVMAFLRLPYRRQSLIFYEVKQRQQVCLAIQKQLMARNPRWLRQQELAYSQGRNLIAQADADFYPQVRSPQADNGFCQIRQDLSAFCTAFDHYYQNQADKTVQKLYPPRFYVKMK